MISGPSMTEGMRRVLVLLGAVGAVLAAPAATAASLDVRIETARGTLPISESVRANIRAHVSAYRFVGARRLSPQRTQRLADRAAEEAAAALRPFGYYQARVEPTLERDEAADAWTLTLTVDPGPPLRVAEVAVQVTGPGAEDPQLRTWARGFPVTRGERLDQREWEEAKARGEETARARGYFAAEYTEHRIEVDLESNTARLALTLETGARAVFGETRFDEVGIDPVVLSSLPRYAPGDPYVERRIKDLRDDLNVSGWFDRIEIRERRDLGADPPVVNLEVGLTRRKPNTYQGTVGYGTDSGARVRFNWDRYLISPRGDSFGLSAGYQSAFDEYVIAAEHRLPRPGRSNERLITTLNVLREKDEVVFRDEEVGRNVLPPIDGARERFTLRFADARLRTPFEQREPVFEWIFVEALFETFDTDAFDIVAPARESSPEDIPEINDILNEEVSTVSLGVRWEWPEIRGRGFDIAGHHEQFQLLASNDGLVSDASFVQAWYSTRWETRFGERFKLIARGEVGYTDADTRDFTVESDLDEVPLSLTVLPEAYRFYAGGAKSVRGYDFQTLTNNGYGSNHLLTGSLELEYRLWPDWSAAVFFDVGNAFNDWGAVDLKRGAGIGVRWYSVVGPLRLDFAKGLDKVGDPWTVHFTIGSILL